MKILFQGDSITHAFRKEEEQNPGFQLGNGYAFLIASQLDAHSPERGWNFVNRGVCGDGVSQVEARWAADTLDLAPDCLSLLLGVNDTVNAMQGREHPSDKEFGRIYTHLVTTFTDRFPAAKVVLVEPFLLEAGVVTSKWLEHLKPRQEFVRELGERLNHTFVPTQAMFNSAADRAPAAHWIWDGIHPSHAGFQLIAEAWLAATHPWLMA